MTYRKIGPLEQCYYVIRWWLRHVLFGGWFRKNGS